MEWMDPGNLIWFAIGVYGVVSRIERQELSKSSCSMDGKCNDKLERHGKSGSVSINFGKGQIITKMKADKTYFSLIHLH